MNFVWLPRRSDGLQRVTSSLGVACLAAIVALAAIPSPATAQSEVKSAVDSAGTAINNQLGDWLGVKKPPPPKRRKPAKPAAAKPAAAKPVAATPAETKPAASKPADQKPAAATPVDVPKPVAAPTPLAKPKAVAEPAPSPAVAPQAVAAPKTAALPLPPPRPYDGAPRAAAKAEPITPLAVTPFAIKPVPIAKPAPLAAPLALAPPVTATANVPLPPRPPIARPSAPRLAALPSPEAAPTRAAPVEAIPAPPTRAPAPQTRTAALPPVDEAEPEEPAKGAAPAGPVVATICPELSNENLAVFTPVQVSATQAACTVDRGVSMSAVKMRDGRMVRLEPAAILRCEMAASVASWLRDKVDPAVATLGSPLDVVMVAASQQCRSRNRVKGAKISEHGRGNALDTRGYVLEDGRKFVIGRDSRDAKEMPQAFQELLKASACADFTTILGPGSDGYHEEHLHVDRAVRRTTVALCRWTIGRGGGN